MRRRFHTYLVVTAALLSAGGLASALVAQGSVAAPGGQHQATAQASTTNRARLTRTLVRYLKARGFQVNPGYPVLFPKDASTCASYTYPAVKECFANNPTAPYVIPVVKSWPNEYVDPTMTNAFGRTRAWIQHDLSARPAGGDHDLRPYAAAGEIHGAADN